MATKDYPYEIKDLNLEDAEKMKLYSGELGGFIQIGPKKYMLPQRFRDMAADIYNMEVRPSDVFVVTYPRSGTTWTQELVWMIANDLNYNSAKSKALQERFPFVEFSMMVDPDMKKRVVEKNKNNPERKQLAEEVSTLMTDSLAAAPSPRFVKSHLPLSLLPPNLLEAKVVYIARDPRDVAASFYHLCKSMVFMGFDGDFKTFWTLFCEGLSYWTPFFAHVKEAWEKRHEQNLLFLFYEELQKDLATTIRRVSTFLGKDYTDEQVAGLCEHLHASSFEKNPAVNCEWLKELGFMSSDHVFIRYGRAGGWRDYFDEEMAAQAEKWIDDNLKDTDLKFPQL